jgi:hypothetical protein
MKRGRYTLVPLSLASWSNSYILCFWKGTFSVKAQVVSQYAFPFTCNQSFISSCWSIQYFVITEWYLALSLITQPSSVLKHGSGNFFTMITCWFQSEISTNSLCHALAQHQYKPLTFRYINKCGGILPHFFYYMVLVYPCFFQVQTLTYITMHPFAVHCSRKLHLSKWCCLAP